MPIHGDEAAVGDGDAMGIAGEIGQDSLGATEGPLGVDDPVGPAQRCQHGGEGIGFGQIGEITMEGEPSRRVKRCETCEEEPAEQAREHAHGQEEAGLA
ncbi:hypothetical protein D3C87_1567850 [compost metagenome]